MQIQLDVPYRGEREYLQGGDIYRAIVDHLESKFNVDEIVSMKIKFNNFSRSAIDFFYSEEGEEPESTAPYNGLLWFEFKNGRRFAGRLTESGRKVESRIEGYEPDILAATTVESDWAMVPPSAGADTIEHVIFANKKLHNLHFPLKGAKWIVTGFNLTKILKRSLSKEMKIKIESNFANKITEASISIGGENFGSILFMVSK